MKKRYSVTLTQETVEEFQALSKSMGLRPSAMSLICDQAIDKMSQTLKLAQSKGITSIFDVIDVLTVVRDQVAEIERQQEQK